MTPAELLVEIAKLDTVDICGMLNEAAHTARNTRTMVESLRGYLVTAHWSDQRLGTEIANLEANIEEKEKAHAKTMAMLNSTLDLYKQGTGPAKHRLTAAVNEARKAQRAYDALLIIAKAKNLVGSIVPSPELLADIADA